MLAQPDWVMFGVQERDSVLLYASRSLTQAQLEHEYFPGWSTQLLTFTITMNDYVIVNAPTYTEAFKTLFGQWSPEQEPLELEAMP